MSLFMMYVFVSTQTSSIEFFDQEGPSTVNVVIIKVHEDVL